MTSAALRLRREHPGWFAGDYRPLDAEGPAARHAVSFLRGPSAGGGSGGPAVTVATRLPGGLRRRGGWADTVLPLPPGPWRDVLTGVTHAGPRPLLSSLTKRFPVALLVPGHPPAGEPGTGTVPPPGGRRDRVPGLGACRWAGRGAGAGGLASHEPGRPSRLVGG